MTWQLLMGFVLGFLTWPAGTMVMTMVDVIRSRIAVREFERGQARKRAQFEKDRELGLRAMTVTEWEDLYGPLPERPML